MNERPWCGSKVWTVMKFRAGNNKGECGLRKEIVKLN